MINFFQQNRKVFFFFGDAILIIIAIYLAFFLRFDGRIPSQYFEGVFQGAIVLALIFSLPLFYFFRLYSFSWAYVSTSELISLVKALIISFSFFGATLLIFGDELIFQGFPRSILVIGYFLIFIFSGTIRFSKRIYLQLFKASPKREKERILIAGAGDAGEQILRNIQAFRNSPYSPIGFVDDSASKKGVLIHGLKVLGKISDIPSLVKEKNIESLIIAFPTAGTRAIQEAVEQGRKAGLQKIKIIPSMDEVLEGKIGLEGLREVQVGDLLRRKPLALDQKSIENFIQNKVILITGAAGSIGSELCRQVAKFNPSSLILLDQDETGIFNISEELKNKYTQLKFFSIIADIQDAEKINKIFNQFLPHIIFHAAAYKHVPLMEKNPDEAVKNNIFGTKTVAEIARESGVEKFIFISTDKAVNPTSVMGATKRIGEMMCQILNRKNSTKFISVRFGNVLDSRGSVIPIFREQIKKGGPVEVTHPGMKRYFMLISEACLLVIQAGIIGKGGEVFVLDMGKPIKILDLAREMIRFSGLEPDRDIPIVFTEPRPGERLFEEIFTAKEKILATQNQKIFIAKLPAIDEKKLNRALKQLKDETQKVEKESIIKTLKMATS
ncbi:polysaccharide biosynthesis protein [Patescibacteria group bacterium]|nr:polysaccharide biosynthesis protein [Patescibacteria group bacterium]